VSGFPLLLHGERVLALVVGGGPVAHRKTMALLGSGASVRVVAPRITQPLRAAASERPARKLELIERAYDADDISDAMLVVAATDSRTVNARVAADARARARLVNVADRPAEGNCATVAVHRAGPLIAGISAGGVPRAAARVRDQVAKRFDDRYAVALTVLCELRSRLLADGDDDVWRDAEHELIGPDFCDVVESGTFGERVAKWV
jgi:precorrin-2 dehydrogenase/sirohydrochlorin ferrochelatase